MDKKSDLTHILFHAISYYIAWFACVLFAARDYAWYGPLVVLLLCILQWVWQRRRRQTKHLISFILLLTFAGFVVDTMLMQCHVIAFKANPWPIAICPPWISALWVNFAIVLYACLQPLFDKYILLGILSFFGFPLAYIGGVALGAGSFPLGFGSSVIYAVIWMFLFPGLLWLYQQKIVREK